jgi:excisionase family DNA binding protein
MAASLHLRLAKAESPAAAPFSESDLLELLPVEVRPLARRCLPCLVRIAEVGALRALSRVTAKENGTIDQITITVKDGAARLQVSLSTVRNLIACGELEAVRIRPRSVRIVKASLDAFIERKRQKGVRE